MSGPFATATAVAPAGDGHWSATIHAGWDIAGNANGGYLLALAARALVGATRRPDLVTATAHYLNPGRQGPVRIATEVVKQGKRFATGTATMYPSGSGGTDPSGSGGTDPSGSGGTDSSGSAGSVPGGRPLVAVLCTMGDLAQAAGPELIEGAPPELPEPELCVPLEPTDTFPPPFMGKVELRLHPDDAAFATGNQSGHPLMRGWFRLPAGEPIDSVALLCAVDAFPPTAFNAHLPVAWTPTVELTAHIRANPVPGWLRCRFSTRFVTAGFLEEDGEVWDSAGRLVAQSRQLALVPRS